MQNSKPKQNVLDGQSLLEIHPSRPEIKIIRNIAISNIAKLANKIGNREYRKYIEKNLLFAHPPPPPGHPVFLIHIGRAFL